MKLQAFLNACRWVYNKTLEIRKQAWEEKKETLSLYDTNNFLPIWKKEHFGLKLAHAQCLQNAQLRIDLAFKAFFRRKKAGRKPGYPRFKGSNRYDSFTFPQSGFKLDEYLYISKIGKIRVKKHREIEGQVKALTLRRNALGKWHACFSCEVILHPLPVCNKIVGIDVGLESFATLSTGKKIANPRFFRKNEKILAKAQQKLSVCKENTSRKNKKRKAVAHIYEKITNRRKDFAHKQALSLIKKFGVIIFEKLNVKDMRENNLKNIRKSIGDVAWAQFMQFTAYKAEYAGRTVVFVDPRNTSKKCSRCGQIIEKKLSDRVHSCSCGLVLDRDHNASINILRLGMESLAFGLNAPK